jgi:FtsP/CotA-like multicopper oxidase with cupredoxin domain
MQKHPPDVLTETHDQFSTETADLPKSTRTEIVDLSDGDEFDLKIAPVTKQIGDATVRMLAYNGSSPGPTLRVREGSELVVNVANETELDATVHWHGLRLDNRYDGTHETQAPIPVGGTFTYRIEFPDPGVYWYHPHIREDYGQEMGLYGNILVVPADPEYWPPAHREVLLTLDDVLIEDGKVASFSRTETTYAAMGRFGNVLLTGGETDLSLSAQVGEVVRFYLTNTANTRVFNVALPGARIKLVGGDSGRHEREEFVESAILAPSERVVIDALFTDPGQLTLEHRTPERTYSLARIDVSGESAAPPLADQFGVLRTNPEWVAERERLAPYFDAPPDKALAFVAEMDMGGPATGVDTAVYACPMHPEIMASWEGKCPKCGMKLLPVEVETAPPTAYVCPMHPEVTATWAGTCPKCGMTLRPTHDGTDPAEGDEASSPTEHEAGAHHAHDGEGHGSEEAAGIEWEDDMVDVNRMTTPANMHWNLIDRETGAVNHAIDWRFRVGDQVKLRLVNEMDSDHPMHHPFHIHGAGRFVVLARDGVPEENLVWKDTVLLRTGVTVDILLDVTNAGLWMAHCHIAEHHESGMMFSFNVAPADGDPAEVIDR